MPTSDVTILIIVALIGIIINIFLIASPTTDGVSGPATTAIWGYGAIAMSTLGLMFTKMGDSNKGKSLDKLSVELLYNSGPAFCLLIVLLSIIMLNGSYHYKINKGDIPKEHYKYNTISTITISLQYFLLLYYFKNDDKTYSNVFKYLNYLFSLGNVVMVGIMYIILNFFATDG